MEHLRAGGYTLRPAAESDIGRIVQIYNGNKPFLRHHLGTDRVSPDFLCGELAQMEALGFLSCVILDAHTGEIVGVLDYQPGETVYLSLLMLDAGAQGKGAGTAVFRAFERAMAEKGRQAVRIDVVDDYPGDLTAFWRKLGFSGEKHTLLCWGGKRSRALVMAKSLAR